MPDYSATLWEIPSAAVGTLIATAPDMSTGFIRVLWQAGISISGPISATRADVVPLDALAAARCAALAADTDPPFVDRLVRRADPVDDPQDRAALHTAATMALGRAPVLRWITANAPAVAASPGWREMLPGLGGVTVSVPLAEEALHTILLTKQRLPSELTASLQLNPWFSGRFATRYRRRMKGKRISVRERAATSRGWSHARTIVGERLPQQWRSLHGRGVGRPLDRWSSALLTAYVDRILRTFRTGGVPAVVAPLLVVAAAVTPDATVPEQAAAPWSSLPHDVEAAARQLVRIAPRRLDPDEVDAVAVLRRACLAYGENTEAWRDLGVSMAASHTFAL